jgi:hypothetical protein
MIRDIAELDEQAQYIRVMWRKAHNYHISLARAVAAAKSKLDAGEYGDDWTSERWLLRKAGLFENQLIKMMLVYGKQLASIEKEKLQAALDEKAREKQHASAAAKAKREQERQIRAATKLQQLDEKLRAKLEAVVAKRPKKAATNKPPKAAEPERGPGRPPVPPITSPLLDQLAAEILTAQAVSKSARQQWIDAMIVQATAMMRARAEFPSNPAFSKWLLAKEIFYAKDIRTALVNIGRNIEIAKEVLQQTNRWSYDTLWRQEIRPKLRERGGHVRNVSNMEFPPDFVKTDQAEKTLH